MYTPFRHSLQSSPEKTDFKSKPATKKWPIVYSKYYNINFGGVEKVHPFDAKKWGRIYEQLKKYLGLNEAKVYAPEEATEAVLLMVHTKKYLNSLKWAFVVAGIMEMPIFALVPNCFLQKRYLRPMRFQTNGSILAGELALQRGWAINIGGGFHHCRKNKGAGFCAYADITLLIQNLFIKYPQTVTKAMIVDLDAHQGNGYARDFAGNPHVFIMDVYNKWIYPNDIAAKRSISCRIELGYDTSDREYLRIVENNLETSLKAFLPKILVYNAGTDILVGDPLGKLSITPNGIIRRDEIVFLKAKEANVPIVMLISGGYLREAAKIVADSIRNLNTIGLITNN